MGKKLKVEATNHSSEQNASLESKLDGNQPFLAATQNQPNQDRLLKKQFSKFSWLNMSSRVNFDLKLSLSLP